MCFPFSPRKRQHINKFEPHPFPGQSRKIVYVYWFFLPRILDHPPPPRLRPSIRIFCVFAVRIFRVFVWQTFRSVFFVCTDSFLHSEQPESRNAENPTDRPHIERHYRCSGNIRLFGTCGGGWGGPRKTLLCDLFGILGPPGPQF